MKKTSAKKAPQTQVHKGERIRFGTTPGGRSYSAKKSSSGKHTTVTEPIPGTSLVNVWNKRTDKNGSYKTHQDGRAGYRSIKKGPTTKKV